MLRCRAQPGLEARSPLTCLGILRDPLRGHLRMMSHTAFAPPFKQKGRALGPAFRIS